MNVKLPAAVLMVLLWTFSFAPAAEPREAPANFTAALTYYKPPRTASELKDYPTDDPGLQNINNLLNEGKYDQAFEDLKKAAHKTAALPSEYVMMHALLVQSSPPTARSWLEKALVKTPEDPEPWLVFGELALQENRIGEANLDFAKAKQLLSAYLNVNRKEVIAPALLNGMAKVAESREQWAEAKTLLEQFLRSSPEDVDGLQRLAHAQLVQAHSAPSR